MAKANWAYLDVSTLNFEDDKTWDLICSGNTDGVFQVESAGMKEACRRVAPRGMEDLIAILALYRPDTMGELEHFIKRKHGQEEITYIHPDLIPILSKTYGCLVYQEQIMAITKKFAGFSDAEADKFRKGIGKKNKALVQEQAEKFHGRCLQEGYPQDIAEQLTDILRAMGGYSFNKGHSAGYAILTYKTAYLKANHMAQFMASLLSNQKKETGSTNYEKVGYYVYQSIQNGVKVFNPDVNKSDEEFTPIITYTDIGLGEPIKEDAIMYGLNLVKGLGKLAIEVVMKLRPFNSFEDFLERACPESGMTKTAVVALIKSGGFDFTGRPRAELLMQYGEYRFNTGADDKKPIKNINKTHIEKLIDANIVKGNEVLDKELCTRRWNEWRKLQHREDWDEDVMGGNEFSWEFETISYHLLGNPFEGIEFEPWEEMEDGQKDILVGGVIIKQKKTKVKRGKQAGSTMCFLTMETQDGVREATVFATQWERLQDILGKGAMVVLKGEKQGEQMTVSGAMTLDEYKLKNL